MIPFFAEPAYYHSKFVSLSMIARKKLIDNFVFEHDQFHQWVSDLCDIVHGLNTCKTRIQSNWHPLVPCGITDMKTAMDLIWKCRWLRVYNFHYYSNFPDQYQHFKGILNRRIIVSRDFLVFNHCKTTGFQLNVSIKDLNWLHSIIVINMLLTPRGASS